MPLNHSPTRNQDQENMQQAGSSDSRASEQVHRVAMKSPPFWSEEPELWFAQLEGQFMLSGITQDSTKYAHVISQLDTRFAKEVKDLITNPPAEGKYAAIKAALIQRLSASQEQRTRQLLEHEELGDRKPSQFLRHLRTLGGTTVPEQLLRTLWLGRLPKQLQIILATRNQDKLEEVAEQADRIQEVTCRSTFEVAAAESTSTAEQIRKLSEQIAELQTRSRYSQPERGRDRSRSGSRTPRNKRICFYHKRFGAEAKKCKKPCNFAALNTQGNH